MSKRALVVEWNGKDVPVELQALPAGRYLIQSVDEALTEAEEAGIAAALSSYRQGNVVEHARAREIRDAVLRVHERSAHPSRGCADVPRRT